MSPIIDTNVLINAVKGNSSAKRVLDKHSGEKASITVINRYEFLRGVLGSRLNPAKREKLLELLDRFKVYEFTSRTAYHCAEVYCKLKGRGSLVNELDILILGICIENNEVLITSDRDFLTAAETVHVEIEFVNV